MATISAFEFIRDGVKYHYPFIESILAVLPIVDEFILLEGYSSDNTYEKLITLQKQYPNKIKVFRQKWYKTNPTYRIFGDLTNRCIEKCQSVWHWQIAADEIYHEDDLPEIKKLAEDENIDWYSFGFHRLCTNAFDKQLVDEPSGKLKRIRFARRITYPYIHSIRDAFSFQDTDGSYKGKDVSEQIKIFHYSYTRHPKSFQKKVNFMMKTYFSEDKRFSGDKPPEYSDLWKPEQILPFSKSHPEVMKEWMEHERKGE